MSGREDDERPLSPSSQIGRQEQTGGTPESRRRPEDAADDPEEWLEPAEEDEPVDHAGEPEP